MESLGDAQDSEAAPRRAGRQLCSAHSPDLKESSLSETVPKAVCVWSLPAEDRGV